MMTTKCSVIEQQIEEYEQQAALCRSLQKPGDWVDLLGEMDAVAEINRLKKESEYEKFIAAKAISFPDAGINVNPESLNKMLFPFQRDIVEWALRKGRAAIFADCGMGKTICQLEFAHHIPGRTLILAPLAVSQQTVREGKKFGIAVEYARKPCDAPITITNYEMLDHFKPSDYQCIVLDESGILKSYTGQFRNEIISAFRETPYRLACTATPAPNDFMELGNHSEFLGALTRTEMLSTFFVHDGGDTSKWRVKRHAEQDFWKWVCSWAVMLRKPSDLGYSDEGFILPPIHFHDMTVEAQGDTDGKLFHMPASTLQERRHARQSSVDERAAEIVKIVVERPDEPWLIWCNLNTEAETGAKLLGAVNLTGSDEWDDKERKMLGFTNGDIRILLSKPSIAGHGMNWQHCRNVVFFGLSDSFEQFYQAIRRCWRFGQKKEVHCYIVTAENEGAVTDNIRRKEKDAARMAEEMVNNMHELNQKEIRGKETGNKSGYRRAVEKGDGWDLHLGDCVEVMRHVPAESVHFSLFSPPYSLLYCYSASERDMGNSRDNRKFFQHFSFLVTELRRVMKPGRIVAVDCMNLPIMKERDGYIGLRDFRGQLIRAFERKGFIFHSEHCMWKDPLIEVTRTKALGLMHKQLCKDSTMCRAGLPQYLLGFRAPGENQEAVAHPNGVDYFVGNNAPKHGVLSHERWQRYADPVWTDIDFGNTLNAAAAREAADERHICPMTLDAIHRAIWLYSNPGDLVLDPFAGIGSTGYVALQQGRRFVGIELKESYWSQCIVNLRTAVQQTMPLFCTETKEVGAEQ